MVMERGGKKRRIGVCKGVELKGKRKDLGGRLRGKIERKGKEERQSKREIQVRKKG